jgi:hypothetical protein
MGSIVVVTWWTPVVLGTLLFFLLKEEWFSLEEDIFRNLDRAAADINYDTMVNY